MNKKYLIVSLEDPRTKKIADVLSNKTCKKIIDLLAEKEASKTEIAKALKMPLNTIDYNINKLVEAGLIERSKNYFWSTKGKKIEIYKISNKSILISPKPKNYLKPIIPAALISAVITLLAWFFSRTSAFYAQRMAAESTGALKAAKTEAFLASIPSWSWILIGIAIAILAYIIILIVSWKRLIKL